MAGLKTMLRASSLIEGIVASLIFITVFILSLSTLTGLRLREDEGYGVLEAERSISAAILRHGDGARAPGSYTDEFGWGEITTRIEKYGDYENIQQVVILARVAGSRKTIEHRLLVAVPENPPVE